MACSNNPQNVNEHVWYYEYPGRLDFIIEAKELQESGGGSPITIRIPWRKLLASLKRRPKVKR